ncbi:MAG: HDIG domain-containing protein [Bacteroidia bacterium]|nr:HDIG domain-containing protein [Bacteroidia bacterium]
MEQPVPSKGFLDLLKHSMIVKILLAVFLVVVIAMLYPKGLTYQYEYREGDIWIDEDLIAQFAFAVYRDPKIVEKEQREAAMNTPWSFDRFQNVRAVVRDSIERNLDHLERTVRAALSTRPRRQRQNYYNTIADSLARSTSKRIQPPLTGPQWRRWLALLDGRISDAEFARARMIVLELVEQMYSNGYIDREKPTFHLDVLAIRLDSTTELRTPVKDFFDRNEAGQFLRQRLRSSFPQDTVFADALSALSMKSLIPNVLYNNEQTQFAIQAAVNNVARTDDIVKSNERIVSRHERVTPNIKRKLDSYVLAKAERAGDSNELLLFLGRAGHTIAILFLPVIYISLFRKRIIMDNARLLLIATIILLIAFLSYLTFTLSLDGPVQYLIIVPAAAMLLTVIFDSRVAFYTTVTISFLVGALRGNEYSIIIASILAGSMAIYTVRDIKNRTQIFRSLMFIFLGYAFAIVVNGLQRSISPDVLGVELAYALANSILSPVFTFGLLIFFEKVFRITTDLTLLELSDFNHPLLRDLSARAPGTFHHSIVMGTLAEAAATAIGANATLARVGAYYHDIGKMLEPEFFVENQIGTQNVHDSLDPKSSARHIMDHVLRGIELAKEHNIPDRVIEFIPAHHGTTLVSYFYEKERAGGDPDTPQADFRYGGPRPSSKETAIVMLADTIEAATRAIEEPTIDKIRDLIDRIVAKRLAEGELNDSDLTFRELTIVKSSFLNILTGIHHSRIKYPSEEDAKAAKKIAERTSRLLNLPSTADALQQRLKKLDSF